MSTQMVEASVDGGSILLSLSASTPSLGSASSAKAGAFSMVRDGRLWRAFVDDDRASVAEFDSSGSGERSTHDRGQCIKGWPMYKRGHGWGGAMGAHRLR